MHQARHDADSYQRFEVITGVRRRRSWSEAEKARIVTESAESEANVSEVARRNGVNRGLLNVWRRQARIAAPEVEAFARVRLDDGAERRERGLVERDLATASAEGRIEIAIADATVRVPANVDGRTLERVLAALRSTR